jgi:hypothetical protein
MTELPIFDDVDGLVLADLALKRAFLQARPSRACRMDDFRGIRVSTAGE